MIISRLFIHAGRYLVRPSQIMILHLTGRENFHNHDHALFPIKSGILFGIAASCVFSHYHQHVLYASSYTSFLVASSGTNKWGLFAEFDPWTRTVWNHRIFTLAQLSSRDAIDALEVAALVCSGSLKKLELLMTF